MDLTSVLVALIASSPQLGLTYLCTRTGKQLIDRALQTVDTARRLRSQERLDQMRYEAGSDLLRMLLDSSVRDRPDVIAAFANLQAALVGSQASPPYDSPFAAGGMSLATVTSIVRRPAAEERRDRSGP